MALMPPLARGDTLTALGRVLPRSGIIDVEGVPGDTIDSIAVKEGDWVQPGQPLARLSSAPEAEKGVANAEADLAATKANAARDIEIAQKRIAAAETELKFAVERSDRMNAARNSEFISPDQIEDRYLARETAEVKLLQARDDLERTKLEGGKSVRAAEADLTAAQLRLSNADVRAPIRARVLKTRGRVGATVGRTEIFKLGDTSSMVVVAEVYEADVLRVKTGQRATISSVALPKKMTGVVSSVSSMIYRNSIETLDPNDNTQTRIVEVTIQMDEATPLDRLVLLQVDVTIEL
jgi:HlyD family secretion protein